MTEYPYFSINLVEGGLLKKLFKNKHYKTATDANNALIKWLKNHPTYNNQIVILEYTTYYTSRIYAVIENEITTWIK